MLCVRHIPCKLASIRKRKILHVSIASAYRPVKLHNICLTDLISLLPIPVQAPSTPHSPIQPCTQSYHHSLWPLNFQSNKYCTPSIQNMQSFDCSEKVPDPDPNQLVVTNPCVATTTSVTWVSDVISGNPPCNYVISRTYRAENSCGSSATATQLITVVNNNPPVLSDVPLSQVRFATPQQISKLIMLAFSLTISSRNSNMVKNEAQS